MSETSPQEYAEQRKQWEKSYKPVKFVEYSAENYKNMKSQDPRYVWTEHDTCDGSYLTAGFHFFGDPPFCCWTTFGWHIAEVASISEDTVVTSAFIPCSVCNPDGEGDGDPNCEGPEIPEGADGGECEDGWVQWYFD